MFVSSEEKLAMAGYPHRPDWVSKPMTRQPVRTAHTRYHQDDTRKANRFPRGNCAARMAELGWEFNEG